MMEDEFVTRRQWLTRGQFLDHLAAANLIPGPSSTEMAIFIGHEKRGLNGVLKPVVIAIVVQAIWKLARAAVKTKWLAFAALVAAVLYPIRVHEILTLIIAAGLTAAPSSIAV